MSYKRITIRRADRNRTGGLHDEIYRDLEQLLGNYIGVGRPTHKNAQDVKLFVDEIADNFLKYDSQFMEATIDVSVSSETLAVEITVRHDGNDFDPLDPKNNCPTIQEAAHRLNVRPQQLTVGAEEYLRLKICCKLTED